MSLLAWIILFHAIAFTAVAVIVTRDIRRANSPRSATCPDSSVVRSPRSLCHLNPQLFR